MNRRDTESKAPQLAADTTENKQSARKEIEVSVPLHVDLNAMHDLTVAELFKEAQERRLRVAGNPSKFQLIHDILSYYGRHRSTIEVEGVMEAANGNGFGFLRWPRFSFSSVPDNIYVSPSLIRNYQIKPGILLRGTLRIPKQREKFLALESISHIEGIPSEDWNTAPPFDKLTPLFPNSRIILENAKLKSVSTRVVDLVAPLGKGQRGLIVAPPRSGKTILLKDIAKAITENHPEIELMVLLVDERPEEVTDFKETVEKASVFSSTFDEPSQRHIQVSEIVIERARRLVEMKKDVVILLDSLTRLTRGYNSARGAKGPAASGGVNAMALQKARRFFSSARNVEEGGSLTILATALVETESKMDEVIFEEFKGTGNLEIQLDRELVDQRIFPAIHVLKSGTRKDDLLYHPDEMARVAMVRRQLAQVPAVEAMVKLIRNIENTASNVELLLAGLK